jgi:transcriptional regulator of acetoin/glycerol metabolism
MALGRVGATLTLDDLPAPLKTQPPTPRPYSMPEPGNLHALERRAIDEAIASSKGNVAAAARKLGVSRSTIYRRLNEDHPAPCNPPANSRH